MEYTKMYYSVFLSVLIVVAISNSISASINNGGNKNLPTIHANVTAKMSWHEVFAYCHGTGGSLLRMDPDPNIQQKTISNTKRKLHISNGTDVWVGDYETYNVIVPENGRVVNVTVNYCVGIVIAAEKPLNGSMKYEFDLKAVNCANNNSKVVCQCWQGNSSSLIIKGDSVDWKTADEICRYDNQNCSLWIPEFTTFQETETGVFGKGQITLVYKEKTKPYFPLSAIALYWVGLVISVKKVQIPVKGTITRCGYLTYFRSYVKYGYCEDKKGFVCDYESKTSTSGKLTSPRWITTTTARNTLQLAVTGNDDKRSGGAYAGIAIGCLVLVGVCVGTSLWWRRHRRNNNMKEMQPNNVLPQDGQDLVLRKDKNNENIYQRESHEMNRMTTYAQINHLQISDQFTMKHENDPAVLAHDSLYDNALMTQSRNNHPDVIQETNHTGSDYLPMDGHITGRSAISNADKGDNHNTYDFLSSIKKKDRCEDFEESGNIYGAANYDGSTDSVYDSATFQRHPSQKTLISDYDHVSIESGTMHKNICNSIAVDEQTSPDRSKMTIQNPNYNRVVIQ